ncbi:MAG: LacI family DNA-binding transcriptional regulator [Verrucomicrobiota bacterium]
MPNPATYRKIAELAGVSVFSVSCALRNRPGVSEATRERIREVALSVGYKPNPLVTALMTRHRTQNNRRQMRAIIACLFDKVTRANRARVSTNRESHAGYLAACDEAGFITEEFIVEDFKSNPRRLFSALRARRVPGVIIQAGILPEWCSTGWEHYALASVGNRQLNLPSHFAGTDHYRNSWLAAAKLSELGYRRIGFAMSRPTG